MNMDTTAWLVRCPASDLNFKLRLAEASETTLRAALAEVEGKEGEKIKEKALRTQLKKVLGAQLEAVKDTNLSQNIGLALEMTPLIEERQLQKQAAVEQVDREQAIAIAHETAGVFKGLEFGRKVVTVAGIVSLAMVKQSKGYRGIGTWEDYCKYLGLDRHTVDQSILTLHTFGQEFTETVTSFGLGYREMRKLRHLAQDGTVQFEDGTITIEGETIPVDADHAPEVEAAVHALLEKHAAITARVDKLEKHLDAAVKEETKGLLTEKKALLKEVHRLKAFDPEEKDREWSVEQMAAIEQATIEYTTLVGKFIIDPRMEDDRHLQARVSGHLQGAEMMLVDLRHQLDRIINLYND